MQPLTCRTSVLLVLVMFSICGCFGNDNSGATPAQKKEVRPVRVMTVTVEHREVRRTSTQPATVHALHRAEIRPRVSGYLSDVKVDIGDVIEKGKPLAILDTPELQEQRRVLLARIERQKAEEDRARAGVELANAKVVAAQAELETTKSQLQSVEALLTAVDAELRRTTDLVERGSLEARILDEVRKKRDSELARKAAVTSAVASAKAAVTVASAGRASADADLKAARADTKIVEHQLQELDVQIAFGTLTAPFTGMVTARSAEPGNLAGMSQPSDPLFVLSQVDFVRIHVFVPERDASFVNRGDSIELTFPSFASEEAVVAEVTRTSGSLDPNTRMMLVEAVIRNEDGRFIPGMFGQATILLDAEADVAVLPARAVRFTESGDAFVYAVTSDAVSIVNVTTGADDGSTIEIVSGLDAGQAVIDAHLQRFTDGQQVEILN